MGENLVISGFLSSHVWPAYFIAKMKVVSLIVEKRKYPVLNPLSRSACPPFSLRMERFEPIRCLIVERAVGTFGVVKFYVDINASHELALGVILGPINLLSLHGGKEGLGHSIVMRTAGLRERLDNLVHAKQFSECVGCILRALVAVKHQLLGLISVLICLTKGSGNQIGAIWGRYSVGYHSLREKRSRVTQT